LALFFLSDPHTFDIRLLSELGGDGIAHGTQILVFGGMFLGFGIKGGLGLNPDQFVLGLQYSLGKAVGVFRIVPNVHVGFGDFTSVDFNVDFLARLTTKDSGFGFYGGAAPTFITGEGGYSEFGITLVGGVQVPIVKNRATNLEARFGLGDIPDFRLLLSLIL
jgi:hypothetical protein